MACSRKRLETQLWLKVLALPYHPPLLTPRVQGLLGAALKYGQARNGRCFIKLSTAPMTRISSLVASVRSRYHHRSLGMAPSPAQRLFFPLSSPARRDVSSHAHLHCIIHKSAFPARRQHTSLFWTWKRTLPQFFAGADFSSSHTHRQIPSPFFTHPHAMKHAALHRPSTSSRSSSKNTPPAHALAASSYHPLLFLYSLCILFSLAPTSFIPSPLFPSTGTPQP